MKEIMCIITEDGSIFKSKREAEKYLNVTLSDRLADHTAKIVKLTIYQEVKNYLLDNLEDFSEILSIKKDLSTFDTLAWEEK